MNASRTAKRCRVAGRLVMACSVLVLIGGCVALDYLDPERHQYQPRVDPEFTTVFRSNWWPRVLGVFAGGIAGGCTLLWLGSAIRPKTEREKA
jgi:hypothetical protein